MAEHSFDPKMLEVLVCPKTQTTLVFDAKANELISHACGMAFPIRSGVPIMLHIPEEKGFIFSSSVVTCGLILLVILMALSVILWSVGLGPQYT